jgi:hypothetical protein
VVKLKSLFGVVAKKDFNAFLKIKGEVIYSSKDFQQNSNLFFSFFSPQGEFENF